jgi:ATP-dependent RNA helicase DeaD
MSFENLGLNEELVKAVRKIEFVDPTLIQEKVIPEIITGDKDLVGLAQTGTGKTAAFGLPMIQLIDSDSKQTQGVVICPTRELCLQISGDFKDYSRYVKGMKIVAIYGGASIETQIRQVKKGVQIIVATPGRLLDLIKRRVVNLSHIAYAVLDEADEMLNMGFQEDIDAILSKTPENKRTWLFSATMPKEVAKIAGNYMKDPVEITAGKRNSVADNIQHTNYIVREKDRYLALKRILDYYPDIFGLIFCRTRNETRQVAEKLIKDGYNAEALHGDLSQAQRDNVMRRFREKSLQALVATDVAARGLDVDDISHVINYNLPDEPEVYTHRSGRTARAGKSGTSIVLMNTREARKLSAVEHKSGIKFNCAKVPGGYAICEKQLYAMVSKLVGVQVNHKEIEKFLPPVYDTLAQLTKEELIQRFVSTEFNRFLNYYKNTGDLNAKIRKNDSKGNYGSKKRTGTMETQRLFINMGMIDNVRKGTITRLVCEESSIKSSQIGKIEILREFSFFEVELKVAGKVLKSLKDARLDGRKFQVQFAEKRKNKKKVKRMHKRASSTKPRNSAK